MFDKILKIIVVLFSVIFLVIVLIVLLAVISPNARIVLPVEHRPHFDASRYNFPDDSNNFPGAPKSKGREIIDPEGTPVKLLGLMAPDPAHLDSEGKFKKEFYVKIHETGANVVRIPVHPERWVQDSDYLWRHLDPIVGWAGQLNMYVIIDWHYIGNIQTGAGNEMPDIGTAPKELTIEFWKLVSFYFRDTPNVIFEIWNEPAGGISADAWQKNAVDIVRIIRSQGAKQLVIVGGIDYSRDLSWVIQHPLMEDNVAYAAHIYPAHPSSMWDTWFGDVGQTFPVIVTEWGFMDENRNDAPSYLIGTRTSYGEPFLKYLDERGIGWVACWWDDEWKPPMYTRGWKAPTNYGQFITEKLQEHERLETGSKQ
jgi:endoglucanase